MAEYIECEALIDYIDNRIPKLIASSDGKHIVYVETIREIIVNFPTADVAPVRHGHWIEEYDCGYITPHCSECGETALTKEETSYDYVYSSYCPRCGAKMAAHNNNFRHELRSD